MSIRIPDSTFRAQPWRIHAIAADFILEDAWILPVSGDQGQFPELPYTIATLDLGNAKSRPLRTLWRIRDRLGKWFGWGRIDIDHNKRVEPNTFHIPGTSETSLKNRLPAELQHSVDDLHYGIAPMSALYMTDNEFAAELSNKTIHAIMHLSWVEHDGRYQGQMAVYIKYRGVFSKFYMTAIKPLRRLIVFPALMREIAHAWERRTLIS